MCDKKIYIVAKIFDKPGSLAYLCKTPNEARCLPGTLEALRAEGVQIVILDSPEIYSEYAPYSYVEDMKAFIDKSAARQKILCKSRNASVVSRQRIRRKYCLNPSGTEFVLTRLTYLCSGMRDGMHAQRECRLSSRKC